MEIQVEADYRRAVAQLRPLELRLAEFEVRLEALRYRLAADGFTGDQADVPTPPRGRMARRAPRPRPARAFRPVSAGV